jgi:hypothetical protein
MTGRPKSLSPQRRRVGWTAAVALAAAAAALTPGLRAAPGESGSRAGQTRGRVLVLGTMPSAPPCETWWERGSAPDASHAWIDLHSTSDGGRSWHVATLTAAADAAMHLGGILDPSDESTGLPMRSAFINPRRGWLAVPRHDVTTEWETRDGGTTWRPLPDLLWSQMRFADARHGLPSSPRPCKTTRRS